MNKNDIERMCRNAGLQPELRERVQGIDVFVADGFAAQPGVTFKRFGGEDGEFPFGAFVTMWWTAHGEDKIDVGAPLFFDAFHNPEFDSPDTKKRARINRAMNDAAAFLKARERVRADA